MSGKLSIEFGCSPWSKVVFIEARVAKKVIYTHRAVAGSCLECYRVGH